VSSDFSVVDTVDIQMTAQPGQQYYATAPSLSMRGCDKWHCTLAHLDMNTPLTGDEILELLTCELHS
jgi:hypothetical protein